jgi:hypothetical protein
MHCKLWLCDECGSPDTEVSAWIHANTGRDTGGEGPASRPYCPTCEAEASLTVIDVLGATDQAAMVRARRWAAAWEIVALSEIEAVFGTGRS